MIGHNQTSFNLSSMQFSSHKNILLQASVRVYKHRLCMHAAFCEVCTAHDKVRAAVSALLLLLILTRLKLM